VLLDQASARTAVDAISLGLLATALVSTLLLRTEAFVRLLVLQGVLLAAAAGAVALPEPSLHGIAALLVTIAVKVVGVPAILALAARRLGQQGGAEIIMSRKLALVAAVALALLAYYVTAPISRAAGDLTPNAMPAAVSLVLLGLFTMTTRKKALVQVVGLVMMENGIYLAALVVTRGLPLAVELGVAVDILVGVIVMGLVARQIQRAFAIVDVDQLTVLRD
jgi:hydrogenase-4 component E